MVGRLVLPGQYIGTEEEFLAGSGTYEDGGRVYSANIGNVEVSPDFKVRVKGRKEEIIIQPGDEIIGVVSEINEPLVVVAGEYLIRSGKAYEIKTRALVHASRITGHYLDQCSKVVKARDVIRGKVVSTRGKIDLTMEPPDEGVIFAYCSKCRKPLQRINSGLYCTYCQRNEVRKVSRKYGEISEGVKKK
ncbi:MAG: exosome complex RNA-binding protein Csl4 [Thermoplasmatales archaeon]|jgi:exosome complex component CSL4